MTALRDSKDVVEALRNGLLGIDGPEQTTLDREAGIHNRQARTNDVVYHPSPTMKKFHQCNDLVRGIMGPYGSGKSVACVMEHYYRTLQQRPTKGNIRWTRSIVIRNTAQELRDTTLATLLEWMPDGELGTLRRSQQLMMFRMGVDRNNVPNLIPHPSGDGTFIACDIIFRAIDRPEQQRKLLSAEYTFGWINEFREVPSGVVTALSGRIGRFPGKGLTTWRGIWMDTNPFDEGSDYDRMFSGEVPQEIQQLCDEEGLEPPRLTLFEQPGGMEPDAENLKHLDGGRAYYIRMLTTAKLEGRSETWVDVHVHGKRGAVVEGKAVWGSVVNRHLHLSDSLNYNPQLPLYAGMDFGLTPALVVGQRYPDTRWAILGELIGEGIAAAQFGHEIKEYFQRMGWPIQALTIFGDPAGLQRSQTDLRTVFDILKAGGLRAQPARHQSPTIRVDSVTAAFQNMTMTGKPRMQIDRSCVHLVQAVLGGYVWDGGSTATTKKPKKNKHSHVADAYQYLVSSLDGHILRAMGAVSEELAEVQARRMEPAVVPVFMP